jgi:F1F0 ATPase subunit 2
MNEAAMVILACVAGLGLGAMFFGGLWWTLQKAMTSQQPALWFASSLLLRTGLTLLGIYFVSAGHWQRMLACLLGFAVSRVAITWLTRPRPSPVRLGRKVSHAAQS